MRKLVMQLRTTLYKLCRNYCKLHVKHANCMYVLCESDHTFVCILFRLQNLQSKPGIHNIIYIIIYRIARNAREGLYVRCFFAQSYTKINSTKIVF